MTDYTKSTNFASKDTLSTGNALKIVKGTEIDTEFNNIAIAVATKADLTSPTLVTPDLGTPSAGVLTNATGLPLTSGVTGTLPVANGGTGATTLTGILKGNGTSAFTAVTAPSGTIVGTSDTQTLTNKTLTSPSLNYPILTYVNIGGDTVMSSSGIGYDAGSGGSVTQTTSKIFGVTLNKASGKITMNNAALAAGASVYFTLSNSVITNKDNVIVNGADGWLNYRFETISVGAGLVNIRVTNVSGGSLSDAVTINFSVIKGANT